MRILKLIYVFYKMKLLSPLAMFYLFASIFKNGSNVMALLNFAGRLYGNHTALVDDNEVLNYHHLALRSEKLAAILFEQYQLRGGQKAGFLCRNHASLVTALFAVSRLGPDIYLLNPEMGKIQAKELLAQQHFDFIVYDYEFHSVLEQSEYTKGKIISYHHDLPAINNLFREEYTKKTILPRASMSKLILLTGGTTGKSKEAAHKPSLLNYLNPFLGILTRLRIMEYKTAYIATPIYHGYGAAVLLLFIALGKKIVLTNRFEPVQACTLIREHQVEVVMVVPLMIDKMLRHSVEDLKSLACIASGSAPLNPRLSHEVMIKLEDILYNLYGTSETGLNIIATPQDLKYSSHTIGKKIGGVQLRIMDRNMKRVKAGIIDQLCVKTIRNGKYAWIKTGDLGFYDRNGYYFLSGRTDDMVVSGGVNIYPIELEQILIHHPQVEEAAVIGIDDEKFGQRLKAFVKPMKNSQLTKEELLEWLRPRAARFQMPKDIIFMEEMPYTPLGKLDKKQLK